MTNMDKTLTHMQAEAMAQKRFTELMASRGVGYNQIAKEVFFFLPRSFLAAYEQLWYKGLAGKDDGGTGARGAADAEAARVGKASGKGLQGLGGAKRKTYKKYWVIADEEALEMKDKIDKRLRSMTREIEQFLSDSESSESGAGAGGGNQRSCSGCGRRLGVGWNFCSSCGQSASDS